MRKKTLRVLSSLMCLFFLASLFQAPLMAAVETIPVRVGNQTLNVTPGQWVSVRSGTQITHYNVRFVDGKPVALEMSQYTKLVFGDAGVAGSAGSVADDVAQAGSTKPSTSNSSTSKPSGSSNQSSGSTSSNSQSSSNVAAGSTADDVAAAGSVADDVAAGSTQSSGSTVSNSQSSSNVSAGSVADDVAQAGSTSTSGNSPVSSSQGNAVSAGTVADDVAAAGQSSTVSTSKTTTTTTSETSTAKTTWDPSRHPRDPQTGRFISHEEAIKRGMMDPPAGGSVADDVAQSGSSSQSSQSSQAAGSTADDVAAAGSTADDVAAAGSTADDVAAAGSTADDVAQAGAAGAGSVADDAAQTSGNKATVGDKFRAGYETGKGMTNQGIQNVKDSLKSGFSAKNILITAGITVGVDLATQIMRGEKPSMKKALKTVCSAEFAGGVGGAVLGAAAGSFFVPFLSAVPVVGGVLSALAPSFGSIVGSSVGAYVAGDLKNGKFSIREAFKRIDWVGVTGQAIGSTAGAALGSFLGPVGTIVGGMVGGYLGNWAAQKIAGMFRKDGPANMPEIAMPTGSGVPVGGGVITIGGDESTPAPTASQNDTVTISGEVVGDYESEVALAYSKYQELYKLYNEMLRQGRQDDALKVAEAMNAAKKEYDSLRTKK